MHRSNDQRVSSMISPGKARNEMRLCCYFRVTSCVIWMHRSVCNVTLPPKAVWNGSILAAFLYLNPPYMGIRTHFSPFTAPVWQPIGCAFKRRSKALYHVFERFASAVRLFSLFLFRGTLRGTFRGTSFFWVKNEISALGGHLGGQIRVKIRFVSWGYAQNSRRICVK